MIELDRVIRVRALISLGQDEGSDVMQTEFESLGNELYLRAMALKSNNTREAYGAYLGELADLFSPVVSRLTDLLSRLSGLEFMRLQYGQLPESERAAELLKPEDYGDHWMWHLLIELGIKDFHADINSLMDSLAPLVIRMNQELEDSNWMPGFPQIRIDRQRKFRRKIPAKIRSIIDKTDSWWPEVKEVRDVLIHRDHHRIVFPKFGNDDSLLFQLYRAQGEPMIMRPELSYPGGKVVDFSLYSAFVVSGILALLENLAEQMSLELKIGWKTPSLRQNNFRPLAMSLDRLATIYESQQSPLS